MYARLRELTLCKLGHHCSERKVVLKYDGGKLPKLCCYCSLIVGRWSPSLMSVPCCKPCIDGDHDMCEAYYDGCCCEEWRHGR
jgi:hypothetical protein